MFPLKRISFSNEKLQALLFTVLVINLIPGFVNREYSGLSFTILLVFSLFLDTVLNTLRYKKIVCSVSASITCGVIIFFAPNQSLGHLIIVTALALVLGKHVWGGTGKNPLNPAIIGIFLLDLYIGLDYPVFSPVIFLCIPFLFIRKLPSLGFLLSSLTVYYLTGQWKWVTLFLSLVVLTDPVTIKNGLLSGVFIFVLNFIVLYFTENLFLSVLLINLTQFVTGKFYPGLFKERFKPLKFKSLFNVTSVPKKIEIKELNKELKGKSGLVNLLMSNNIQGQGGAAFPLLKKIESLPNNNRVLIVNGAECDPGLFHDKWIMDTYNNELDSAVKYLIDNLGINDAYFASKSDRKFNNIEHVKLKDFFPVGYEKTLIKEVLGVDVPKDKHPTDMGFLIINVQTLLQVFYIKTGVKDFTRYITLGDLDSNSAKVIGIKNNETIDKVLEDNDIKARRVFVGGGLMYGAVANKETVINNKINSIFYGKPAKYKESPQCSLCGLCSRVCPAGINPQLEKKGSDCIKCGACSYVCLAGRNLMSRIC